jgi:hypothetical protein
MTHRARVQCTHARRSHQRCHAIHAATLLLALLLGVASHAATAAPADHPAAPAKDLAVLDDAALQQAIGAQPLRGDLQLERIRRLLGRGDVAAAQAAWDALQRLQPPEGIRALVERWFEQADTLRAAAPLPGARPAAPRHQVQLGAGWDSNPTLGSSSSVLLLGGSAVGQVLQLAPSALPQASAFGSLQLDGQTSPFAGGVSAVYGATYSHFPDAGFDREYLAYGGLASGDRGCPTPLAGSVAAATALGNTAPTASGNTTATGPRCGVSLLLAHGEVRGQTYSLANLRSYRRSAGGLEAGLTLGALHRLGQTESAQLGIDLQRRWTWQGQHLLLRGDMQFDAALGGRAGGDQWRSALQLTWDSPSYAWGARLLTRYTDDSEAFAPALLGPTERRQLLWRAELERRFVLAPHTSWALFARHERSTSNVSLFESDRSVVGITLRQQF